MNAAYRSTRDLMSSAKGSPKPASNQTIDNCPKPLDRMPSVNGMPKYFAYQHLGDQPPPQKGNAR